MADLFGVMLNVPQLERQLKTIGGEGGIRTRISKITLDWVNGRGISAIAQEYFGGIRDDESGTKALTRACRARYCTIVNSGTWGVAGLSRVSDIDFNTLSAVERRRINALPAMIYHGVNSEEAVLMRMNSAPRSVAERLGNLYRETVGEGDGRYSVGQVREFLRGLGEREWHRARPQDAPLSGAGFKRGGEVISGEGGA